MDRFAAGEYWSLATYALLSLMLGGLGLIIGLIDLVITHHRNTERLLATSAMLLLIGGMTIWQPWTWERETQISLIFWFNIGTLMLFVAFVYLKDNLPKLGRALIGRILGGSLLLGGFLLYAGPHMSNPITEWQFSLIIAAFVEGLLAAILLGENLPAWIGPLGLTTRKK